MAKEAQARIKINKLLEEVGWRFFDDEKGQANISLEHRTKKVKLSDKDLGDNFENAPNGFIDYLLLNDAKKPIALIEAKRENIDPLNAKEQARAYALAKGIFHIFLSNGNVHYYWDLREGNPIPMSRFYSLKDLDTAFLWQPNPQNMKDIELDAHYIAVSMDSHWLSYSPEQRQEAADNKGIRTLRYYQLAAAQKLQSEYIKGKKRFLFEMATGTGKTLTSAAIIKMFIRSDNANRVLFLVDRIELEIQARDDLRKYLSNDGIEVAVFKERKTDWAKAEVVVTTIQSLTIEGRYRKIFSAHDFQFIISDEAHRTISGNNRAVFEYFVGAKLGLTATPRDYLKGVDQNNLQKNDPRQLEKRNLLDSYKTFGCENGMPTFRFSLEEAVKAKPNPFLCMPNLLDIKTDITTEILSKEGYNVAFTNENGDEEEDTYKKKDFMKRFFSDETNRAFVKAFLEHAKRDPISNEVGKSIIFCVSRHHCTEITKLLNEEATELYPDKYGKGSTFAVQITSDIIGSQGRTQDFKKNCLNGWSNFAPHLLDYKSSKSRVCVTVGMMTTGYDCPDLLNVVLARPIFSATDYIQIKGRGTRLCDFDYNVGFEDEIKKKKDNFYLFDFFANHQYFQEEYPYQQAIELPKIGDDTEGGNGEGSKKGKRKEYHYSGLDDVKSFEEEQFNAYNIMRVDIEAFTRGFEEKAKEAILKEKELVDAVENQDWRKIWAFLNVNVLDKPREHWTFENLQNHYNVDRRLTMEEIMMKTFVPGYHLKNRTDLVNEDFDTFMVNTQLNGALYNEAKNLFSSYLLYDDIRHCINEQKFSNLATDMRLSLGDLKKLGKPNIDLTLNYIKDNNVSLNKFLPK